jgi:predicted porin
MSMSMKNSLAVAAIAAVIAAPGTASAMKVYGDAIEIYGTLHLSLDYITDTEVDGADENINVASNSSNIGFRGTIPIDGTALTAFYRAESQLNIDNGEGSFGTRDTYIGVDSPAGKFTFGYISTPYKIMGIIFSNYVTTAADPFAILGNASDNSPRLDLRSFNGIQWENTFAGVNLKLMYSAGMHRDNAAEPDGQDDNDAQMWNGSAIWKGPVGIRLGAAFALYDAWFGGPEIDAYRLGAAWGTGPFTVEAIFEDIDSDEAPEISRRAYGANVGFNITPRTNIGAQWIHADESDRGNDEADQLAVVLNQTLSKNLSAYAAYSTVRNDNGGAYRITNYGHDNVNVAPGADAQVFSVGTVLKF